MLEIATIKTTPQSSETQSRNGKNPVNPIGSDENAQEFQTEYEATAEDAEQASEMDVKDASTVKDSNPETESESVTQAEPKKVVTAEGEDVPVELAMGDERRAVEHVTRKIVPETFKTELPNGQPVTPQKESAPSKNSVTPTDLETLVRQDGGSKTNQANTESKQREVSIKSAAETVFMSKAAAHSSGPNVIDGQAKSLDKPQAVNDVAQSSLPQTPSLPHKAPEVRGLEMPRSKKLEEIQLRRTEQPIEAPKAPPANTPAVRLTQTVVPQAQLSAKIDASKDKTDLLAVVSSDSETLGVFEARTGSLQQTTQTLAQVLNRADTPAMIARQMAEALQRLPDRPVEISLNPKELGKVRMSVSPVEAGITVNIVAERPETLDLMRRNIEQLVREFQSLGYDSINFAFSQGESNSGFSENETDGSEQLSTHLDLTNEEEPQVIRSEPVVTTGVDIRL